MANRRNYHHSHTGLRICCVALALMLAAGLTLGGLELFAPDGKKMKPSEWFKSDAELAPVTITLADEPAPISAAQTFENGARAYALATASASYPSTKRATATCTLPEGGTPERYEWEITGGEGLSVKTVNADGSAADVTAQQYFAGTATLTARAYRGDDLRGIGSIKLSAKRVYETSDTEGIDVYYVENGSEEYQSMLTDFRAYAAEKCEWQVNFCAFTTIEECAERNPDYAIFLDEDYAIAGSGDVSVMQDAGIKCFFYNMDIDTSLGYILVEETLAPEGIESALQAWAEQHNEINAITGDLTVDHQGMIQSIADGNDYNILGSASDYEGWQGIINSFSTFNCIALSSSKELPDVMAALDSHGISNDDILWIICDVREAEAQMVSDLISEGVSVCAYKKAAHFDHIFDAIQDLEGGSEPETTICIYEYEEFV